jgi:O-antigen/teichoic acid export membrane protein
MSDDLAMAPSPTDPPQATGTPPGQLGGADDPVHVLDSPEVGGKVIRGGIIRTGGYVLGVALSVGSSALMLRHLGVVDAGRLVTVLALIAIVGGVADLGLTGIGIREYTVRKGDARDRFMRNLIGMRIVFTLIGIAGAVVFGAVAGYTDAMVAGTFLAGLGFVLFMVQQSLAVPLSATIQLGWVTFLTLITQVGMAIGAALLVLADASLVWFFALQIPVMVPVIALNAHKVKGMMPRLPAFDRDAWRDTMKDILPYSAAVIFTVVYFRIVAVLVSLLSTGKETGYFGISFRVLDGLALIPPLLMSAVFPVLARSGRDDSGRFGYALRQTFSAMFILGVWMAMCIALGAQLAIDVVGGPRFQPAVDVLQLQAPAIVGTFLVATWGYGLLSLSRYRAILLCNALALTMAVVMSVVLIPPFGAEGAAVALTAAELSLGLSYGFALMRGRADLRGSFYVVPGALLAAAVASVPLALVGVPSLPALVAASAIYFFVLIVLRAVPGEVMDVLRIPRRVPRPRSP